MPRYLMPGTHLVAPTCVALFLAATGGGCVAHAFINAGRQVDLGAVAEVSGDSCNGPALSHSQPGDRCPGGGARTEWGLRECADAVLGPDSVSLVFYKKKVTKRIETFRGKGIPLLARATRIPILDVDPQKVSPHGDRAILLLRTVVLLL